MKTILFFLMMLPVIIKGQYEQGIHFLDTLSWQQIKEKARQENKYIFVDCYATWCAPCFFMADSIFTRNEVGEFFNSRFISVKVQVDSSKNDNEQTKKWYTDAKNLRKEYLLVAFPTYLFFSPDGKAAHWDAGVKGVKDFISVAESALDPEQQYFTLFEKFRRGRLKYQQMPALANKAKELDDKDRALRIAKDYMHNYLDRLSDSAFCTKENLEFIASFYSMLGSGDRVFRLYYNQPRRVDSIMESKNYAKSFVDYIITKEEITPVITEYNNKNSRPDWQGLTNKVARKYNVGVAERNITKAKVSWHKQQQDWKMYAKFLVRLVENSDIRNLPSGAGSIMFLNNSAWEIFQYSGDQRELKKALTWIDIAIPMDPKGAAGMLDTKANLLYKLGRKQEAIKLQRKAVALEPENEEMTATLSKMLHGKPTWSTNN